MALKIQLRRDTAANWSANNPLLLNGEIGIETDTLKFKIGNGSQRWNSIQFYAFKPGQANGVASLDSAGKVPVAQLPSFVNLQELEQSIQNALSETSTSDIQEGINLYFTNARAVAAGEGVFDPYGSANQAVIAAGQNTSQKISDLIDSAPQILDTFNELAVAIQNNENYVDDVVNLVSNKQNLLTAGQGITIADSNIYVTPNTYDEKGSALAAQLAASTDATNKSSVAKTEAIAAASLDATTKANSAKSEAISAAEAVATTKANNALSAAEIDATGKANLAIAAAALDATGKANAAESAAILSASIDAAEKDLVVLESANSHAEGFIESVVNSLTTSDIEEGASLYFTESRAKQAVASDIADAIAAIPNGGASIASTSQLPEGSNLYFTNARAISATNAARTNVLLSALTAVDDLRSEINTGLLEYLPLSEINSANGVAGLDSSSKIQESVVPLSITRNQSPVFVGEVRVEDNLVVDGNLTVNGTTTTVDTANFSTSDALIYLGEGNVANTIDLGIVSSFIDGSGYQHSGVVRDASDNKWKFFKGVADEPTTVINFSQGSLDDLAVGGFEAFSANIGAVTNQEIQRLSGVTSGVQSQIDNIASTYATTINLEAGVAESKEYTDFSINSLSNSLEDYESLANRNVSGGYAGLDISGKILSSAVPTVSNSMLQNSSININGSSISLGGSVITGYTNGISGSNVNKISYGTSATPPSSGNSAGDIYIQY